MQKSANVNAATKNLRFGGGLILTDNLLDNRISLWPEVSFMALRFLLTVVSYSLETAGGIFALLRLVGGLLGNALGGLAVKAHLIHTSAFQTSAFQPGGAAPSSRPRPEGSGNGAPSNHPDRLSEDHAKVFALNIFRIRKKEASMTTPRPHEDATGVGFVSILDGAYPTMDDLPSEFPGEEALPNEFHALFAILLMETFIPKSFPLDRIFSVLDMYLYFQYQGKTRGFRPDWFGAVDVPALYEGTRMRQSYVVSAEGKPPLIIVEALSKGTEKSDLGRGAWPKENAPSKWDVYETVLKIPYYVTIDHETDEVQLFRHDGTMFVRETSPDGRMWMPEVGLSVGPWSGFFQNRDAVWIRFFDENGVLIPSKDERNAEEKAGKEAALAEVEELRRKLRDLGID